MWAVCKIDFNHNVPGEKKFDESPAKKIGHVELGNSEWHFGVKLRNVRGAASREIHHSSISEFTSMFCLMSTDFLVTLA